jgi:DNA invertase Pin-like site-specific DNA recombinase
MARKRTPTRPQTGRMIGYIRVSTDDQELGPDAQREQLQVEADRRGWTLDWAEDNGKSGTSMNGRTGLTYALDLLARGRADGLVVTKLDRLARSVVDFGTVLRLADTQGWSLVVLDLGVDMTTVTGRFVAQLMANVAEWEAGMIAQRTREGLAVTRAKGTRLGRQSTLPAAVVDRIRTEREAGQTLQSIADGLNDDQVPTGQGGSRWRPSSVRAVLQAGVGGPTRDGSAAV